MIRRFPHVVSPVLMVLLMALVGAVTASGFSKGAKAQILEHDIRFGTDATPSSAFSLNPAAVFPEGEQYDFAASRKFVKNTFDADDPVRSDLQSTTKSESYGVAGVWAAWKGTGFGLTMQREYEETDSENSSSGSKPKELMHRDYLGSRLILGLTPKIRAGVLVRYVLEHASIVGSYYVSQRSGFTYQGHLLGYAAAFFFDGNDSGYGVTFAPVLRGKTKIMDEEKTLAEPGFALFDVYVGKEQARVGLSYYRWVHQRDDRDEEALSADGNTPLSLDGVNFDRALFPVHALTFGGDLRLTPKVLARVSVTQEEGEFIFSEEGIPSEKSGNKRVGFLRFRGGIIVTNSPKLKIQLGFGSFDRKTGLKKNDVYADGDYKGSGSELMLVIGNGV